MAILKQIYLYPVKSLPGIELQRATLEKTGLKGDRKWMLVDESNKFITLREISSLVHFRCELSNDDLILQHQGDSLHIKEEQYKEVVSAQIWADKVRVVKATDPVNAWLSEKIGQKISLVKRIDETIRNTSINEGNVSLADLWPYLVLSQKSIDDLNTRLERKVSIKNFRPNLVVEVDTPYEEDNWIDFSIGDQKFSGMGKCGRCRMVNINYKTGANEGNVLGTLSSYRKEGQKIGLGLSSISRSEGSIEVGMKIQVESVKI